KRFEMVRDRAPALAGLARLALERLVNVDEIVAALPGRFESLAGGRARLTLDFSDAAQLGAFVSEPGFFPDFRTMHAPLEGEPVAKVQGGALRLTGAHALRLGIQLEPPLRIEYRTSVTAPSTFAYVFAAFEDPGAYVMASMWGQLVVYDWSDVALCVRES